MLYFQPFRPLRLCVHLVANLSTRPTAGRGGERLRATLLSRSSYRRQSGYSTLVVPGNQRYSAVATALRVAVGEPKSNLRLCVNNRRVLSTMSHKAYVQPLVESTSVFKDGLFDGKVLFCTGGGSGICKEMTRAVVLTHTTPNPCTCGDGS